ncbi:glycosyl hydrolase family 76-domain-containing protein [Pholiota molesta]|nr:glycosyl hydrolase family 76-domain-containing protein [Pholiota molesta]
MAIQDELTATQANKAAVVQNLNLVFGLYSNYDQYGEVSNPCVSQTDSSTMTMRRKWWATAAIYGSKAYGNTQLLNNAIATWNHVSQYQITQAQAQAGSTPVKSFAIEGTCNGVTMAGGVFWRPTTGERALSAYLAEKTGNSVYTNAAIAAANWIKTQNLNANNIVLDTVSAADCSRSPSTWLFTYNSGKFIEGLSVLANITGDAQWTNLMLTVVASAVENTAWQGSNGVVTEGSGNTQNNDGIGFKAVYIRGLREAYRRTPSNAQLRTLLRSYIDVQYNALLELADNGNFYSASWAGPQPTAFTSWGELAALDVLTAAVEVN